MSEIVGHPWILISLASIFLKFSSILFIIHLSSNNIVHPWPHGKIFFYVTKCSIPCVKKYFIDISKIFLKRSTWAHLLALTCSSLMFTCSQDNIHVWMLCKTQIYSPCVHFKSSLIYDWCVFIKFYLLKNK